MRTVLIALTLSAATLASASTAKTYLQWSTDGDRFDGDAASDHKDAIGGHLERGLYQSDRLTGPLNIIGSRDSVDGVYVTRGVLAVKGACTSTAVDAAKADIGKIALDSAAEIARGTDQRGITFEGEIRSIKTVAGGPCHLAFGIRYYVD